MPIWMNENEMYTPAAADIEAIRRQAGATKELRKATAALSSQLNVLSRSIGPQSTMNTGITSFLSSLGRTGQSMMSLGGSSAATVAKMNLFTAGIVGAGSALMTYGDIMDSIEKKQGELQRSFGASTVSMSGYYDSLIAGAEQAGSAGVEAAESLMGIMYQLRRDSGGEINDALEQQLIKFTTGISINFPKDFEKMSLGLGMSTADITDRYEAMGLAAANARVPFERYKDLIIDTTTRFVKYGVTIDDVQASFSDFTDDIKDGKITLDEAADAINKILEIQTNPQGLAKRAVLLSKFEDEIGFDKLPDIALKELDKSSIDYFDKPFNELDNVADRQFALRSITPEAYMQIENTLFKKMREDADQTGSFTQLAQIMPSIFSRSFFKMDRTKDVLTTTVTSPTSIKDIMEGENELLKQSVEDYRALVDEASENMAEWSNVFEIFQLIIKKWLADEGVGAFPDRGFGDPYATSWEEPPPPRTELKDSSGKSIFINPDTLTVEQRKALGYQSIGEILGNESPLDSNTYEGTEALKNMEYNRGNVPSTIITPPLKGPLGSLPLGRSSKHIIEVTMPEILTFEEVHQQINDVLVSIKHSQSGTERTS